jgi:hypothetical protein
MVELNVRDDFDGDDDCHCHVDDKAERRPPSGVGDVVSAVLPEIPRAVSEQSGNEQPGLAHQKASGDAACAAPVKRPQRPACARPNGPAV